MRAKKPAIFQCVRTSINGVVKTLVVPITRMDQCIPVFVQERGRSGETRRTVVPISSTTVFDTSEDTVSGYRQGRRRQWLRYPVTRLPVPGGPDNTFTATAAAGWSYRLRANVTEATDSEPSIDPAQLGMVRQSYYGTGRATDVPQLIAVPTHVTIEQADEMLSGRNLTRSNRISQLSEKKATTPDCQPENTPLRNAAFSCNDCLSSNDNAISAHCEGSSTIYDRIPSSDMNATPDACSTSSRCSSGLNQETNYHAQSNCCDDTSNLVRIENCRSPSCDESHSTYVDIIMCKTENTSSGDEELQQTKCEESESLTNKVHLHPEYVDPFSNGNISESEMDQSRSPEVELPCNLVKEETECDHYLPFSLNDSTTLGHIYEYEVTKSEGDIESESNSQLLEMHSDEDIAMSTRQSCLSIGSEHNHSLDDTSSSETLGDDAKLDHLRSLDSSSNRINSECVEFDAASALSAYNIRDCVVMIEPLSEPPSSTCTDQETLGEDITQHRSTEMFYSCKQLGPTTIRLVKQHVAPGGSRVPGGDEVRWDTTSKRDCRTNTDIQTPRRHPEVPVMHFDLQTTDRMPDTSDDSRSESEHHDNRTPQTQVARGDRKSNFAFSSASTIKQRTMIYSGVSKLNKSRLKLSRMLQRMAPKASPMQCAPVMSPPTTTLTGLPHRHSPVQDTIDSLSKSYIKGPSLHAESKAYCTRHLEQVLRYHERVAFRVRALLRKSSKTDLTHSASLGNVTTV